MITVNTKSLVRPYTHIYRGDPALDEDASDFEERYERYLDTGKESELPLKPGEDPARFTLEHLRGKGRASVMGQVQRHAEDDFLPMEAVAMACELSVIGCENLADQEGRPIVLRRTKRNGSMALDAKSMAVLESVDAGQLVMDLGLRAIKAMYLPPK